MERNGSGSAPGMPPLSLPYRNRPNTPPLLDEEKNDFIAETDDSKDEAGLRRVPRPNPPELFPSPTPVSLSTEAAHIIEMSEFPVLLFAFFCKMSLTLEKSLLTLTGMAPCSISSSSSTLVNKLSSPGSPTATTISFC